MDYILKNLQQKSNIVILLSTYNGQKYLREQLNSLFEQTYKNFQLIIRDDNSTDNTVEIIKEFQKKYKNIELIESKKNLGAKLSFNELIEYIKNISKFQYIMFCDQDDIWLESKIELTLEKMSEIELKYKNKALLIHTDLKVVDDNLSILDNSFWNYEYINPKLNSLNRLIIQNTVTGCTIMFNRKLLSLIDTIPKNSIMHDWYIALIASSFGEIYYLNRATVLYRQHRDNNTGAKKFNLLKISKDTVGLLFTKKLYIKHLYINIAQAKEFLFNFRDRLSRDTILMLEDFIDIEKQKFIQRKRTLIRYRLLKQGVIRNIALFLKI